MRSGVEAHFSYEPEPDLAEYDLVHLSNLPTAWTYMQCMNAQRQRKSVVVSAIYQETEWHAPYSVHQRTLDGAAKTIYLAPGEVGRMRRHLAFDEGKVVIVPYGLDLAFGRDDVEPFRLPGGEDYILCVGRINDDKNQLLLASVCRDLSVPREVIARALDLSAEQVEQVIADIVRKQRTTSYLRMPVIDIAYASA